MGKNKLKRWSELNSFRHVIQPPFEDIFRKDYELKGKWNSSFFGNSSPIVLELGCGKGEYTVNLAKKYPSKNFIGIDIKGARMWKGASEAASANLGNVAFLRTRIEFINSFFDTDEVDEIWITFPDPQVKQRRADKRLTAPGFLNSYRNFLRDNGIIHLKTDSIELYDYTTQLVKQNRLEIVQSTPDLYSWSPENEILGIRTYYEQIYLDQGKKITYTAFRLKKDTPIKFKSSDGA